MNKTYRVVSRTATGTRAPAVDSNSTRGDGKGRGRFSRLTLALACALGGVMAIGSGEAAAADSDYIAITNNGLYLPTAGSGSVAVGYGTHADDSNASAFGRDANASGNSSLAAGSAAQGTGTSSVALGDSSRASGSNTVAIGKSASAANQNSLAIGNGAHVTADYGLSMGFGANVSGLNSIALGRSASASAGDAVALGSGSQATRGAIAGAANTLSYSGATVTTTQGEISVGSSSSQRQITNVAAGTQSSDAANVGQVAGVKTVVDANATATASALGGGSAYYTSAGALAAPTYNVAGATQHDVGSALMALDNASVQFNGTGGAADVKDRNIVNVAAGALSASSTDAVNGSQLFATNTNVTDNATNIARLTTNLNNGSVGLVQQAAAGADLTVGKAADGTAVDFTGAAGARTLTGVTAGALVAASSDAVNGSQLFATNQNVTSLDNRVTTSEGDISAINTTVAGINGELADAVKYDSAAHDSMTLGNAGSPVVVHNVADGVADTDAVNMNQLKGAGMIDANGQIANVVTYDSVSKDAITLGGTGASSPVALHNVADGSAAGDAVNLGQMNSATTQLGSQIAAVEGRVTKNESDITTINAQLADVVGYDSAVHDSVTLGNAGTPVAVHNVAAGVADTDAVNVSQLKGAGLIGAGNNVLDAMVYDAGSNRTRVTLGGFGTGGGQVIVTNLAEGTRQSDAVNFGQLEKLQDQVSDIDSRVTNMGTNISFTGNGGGNGNPSSDTTGNAQDGSVVQTAVPGPGVGSTSVGAGAAVVGNQGTAVGLNAIAGADNSVAIGSGAQATAVDAVALGQGSVADRANSVSVGAAGSERQVANVAAGTQGTDAVNLSQMNASQAQAQSYTDTRIAGLQNSIDDVAKNAYAGTAAAMAVAGLPQPTQPGKTMVAMAASRYGGQTGAAIGISYVTANNKWVAKVSANTSSSGNAGVVVGSGYQW